MSQTISAGQAPKIMIGNIGGDLSLVGWEGQEILIKGDEDEIRVTQDGETVTLSFSARPTRDFRPDPDHRR
jgi:hypothetical protein